MYLWKKENFKIVHLGQLKISSIQSEIPKSVGLSVGI